jgi:predicted alpha-1,6-mannanase (GH76 family)
VARFSLLPGISAENRALALLGVSKFKEEQDMDRFANATSNDDVLWWSLAFESAYQATKDAEWLAWSELTFSGVYDRDFTDACGGGLLWDHELTYKNAITNELLVSAGTKLAATTGNSSYLSAAQRGADWLLRSGMIGAGGDGLVVDGISDAPGCEAGGGVYTYNQGVALSGLARLAQATGDYAYADAAAGIAAAALGGGSPLSQSGVLREECENGEVDGCDHDGKFFKGIFARHLGFMLEEGGGDGGLREFFGANSDSVWENDREGGAFGAQWTGPYLEEGGDGDDCVVNLSAFSLFNAEARLAAAEAKRN